MRHPSCTSHAHFSLVLLSRINATKRPTLSQPSSALTFDRNQLTMSTWVQKVKTYYEQETHVSTSRTDQSDSHSESHSDSHSDSDSHYNDSESHAEDLERSAPGPEVPLHPSKHELEDKLGDAHVNLLPKKKLIVCLLAMAVSLFTCFCDQTSVTVALPQIGRDLRAENSINWAGTSALLANCVCQVLFGRFADIFGRKNMLMYCLSLLCISNMLCGFAQTGPQFFVFRAFAGIGAGGVQSLSMVIVSDIVTLKQRGKFQGILGAFVGLGNGMGPIIMAAFTEHSTWRNFYRVMPPLMAAVNVIIYFFVDNSKKKLLILVLTTREKLRKIDYYGVFFSTAGLTLLLIPISGGGSTYAWDSPLVIVMFVLGGICTIVFLLVEWKVPELPMIPLYAFKNRSLSILLSGTFLYGTAYFGFMWTVLYYYQLVRGMNALTSAYFLLPLVFTQAVFSTVAGSVISYSGHFFHVLIGGFLFWLVGCCMTTAWKETTSTGMIVGTTFMMGIGVGFIFQPTMVAVQANATMAQRAVVISTRNVLRSFGGALGIATASLIVTNSLLKEITTQLKKGDLPSEFLYNLRDSIYSHPDISTLTPLQIKVVRSMYMTSIRNVFYLTIPLIGICLISSCFVKDRGLQCLDQPRVDEKKEKK